MQSQFNLDVPISPCSPALPGAGGQKAPVSSSSTCGHSSEGNAAGPHVVGVGRDPRHGGRLSVMAVDSNGLRVLLFVTNRADRRGGLSHAEISAEVKHKNVQVRFCLDHPSTVSLCFAGRHLELLCLRWSPAPVGGWVGAHQYVIRWGSSCGGGCCRCPGGRWAPEKHRDVTTCPRVPSHRSPWQRYQLCN